MIHCSFIIRQQELILVSSYHHFSVSGPAEPAGDPIPAF